MTSSTTTIPWIDYDWENVGIQEVIFLLPKKVQIDFCTSHLALDKKASY